MHRPWEDFQQALQSWATLYSHFWEQSIAPLEDVLINVDS